jgi:hypothetical protein
MCFSCLCESCLINDTRGYVITIGNYKGRIQDNVYVKKCPLCKLTKWAFTSSIRDFGLKALCFGNDLVGYHIDLSARVLSLLSFQR